MFRRFVECQLARVRQCPQASMLGARVYERLEDALKRKVELIAGSTTTHLSSLLGTRARSLPSWCRDFAVTLTESQLFTGSSGPFP